MSGSTATHDALDGIDPMKMYGFWRSQATFRVRVALNLKGVAYTEIPVDLDDGAQDAAEFRRVNPMGGVPALMIGETALTQSMAILEYIEETHAEPPLLPKDALGRARVRSLAALAVSDSHPLVVPRIKRYLSKHAGFDAAQWKAWQTQWFSSALKGYESRLAEAVETGTFCHGAEPSFADISLCGLAAGAKTFDIPLVGIPLVERIVGHCMSLPAFEKAKAIHQSDYPG